MRGSCTEAHSKQVSLLWGWLNCIVNSYNIPNYCYVNERLFSIITFIFWVPGQIPFYKLTVEYFHAVSVSHSLEVLPQFHLILIPSDYKITVILISTLPSFNSYLIIIGIPACIPEASRSCRCAESGKHAWVDQLFPSQGLVLIWQSWRA